MATALLLTSNVVVVGDMLGKFEEVYAFSTRTYAKAFGPKRPSNSRYNYCSAHPPTSYLLYLRYLCITTPMFLVSNEVHILQ